MKKIKLLLCMLSLASLGVLTACDDDDDNGSGGGGGGTNDVVAPASVSGKTLNATINSGTPPFAESGDYSITFVDDSSYTINDVDGAEVSTGTYTYTPGTDNTASLVMEDSALGTINSLLTFDSESSGTMESSATDSEGNTGNESSTFTLQ